MIDSLSVALNEIQICNRFDLQNIRHNVQNSSFIYSPPINLYKFFCVSQNLNYSIVSEFLIKNLLPVR